LSGFAGSVMSTQVGTEESRRHQAGQRADDNLNRPVLVVEADAAEDRLAYPSDRLANDPPINEHRLGARSG
jgi:hypothetical protein